MIALRSTLLACALLLFGCAKAAAPTTAYVDEGYGTGGDAGGYAYGGSYSDDMEMAEAPSADYSEVAVTSTGIHRPAKLESRREGKKGGRFRDAVDEQAAMPPMPEPAPTTSPTPDAIAANDKTPNEPEPVGDEDHEARQIIYTASLQLAVYERDEAVAFAEDIPRRHGGWIAARYDYQITLRIPADHLQPVIAELSALGLVLGKTLQADDVTAQYTDLASRIAVLEQLEEQLEILLKSAKTVEESLKVRQELERVRIELESAKAQMRQLAESIDFSTLTVNLIQRGADEALPTSNDPFPWVDQLGVESTEYR
ncbi:DUF4349 domain-containing protein [Nannocystaceae bacterium ST9]